MFMPRPLRTVALRPQITQAGDKRGSNLDSETGAILSKKVVSFGRVAIAVIVPISWRQGYVNNHHHRVYLNYAFRKSGRPVLTVQGKEYFNKSGKVQILVSGSKPGITSSGVM